jgi:hypothetical protein
MSATNVARSGRRRCFNRPAPLLQSPGVSATIIRRHDYKTAAAALLQPPATLLKVVGRSATIAWHRCYKPAAALLRPPRRGCYKVWVALLQSPIVDATSRWWRCYNRLVPLLRSPGCRCYKLTVALLQSPGAAATIARRRCYTRPTPLLHGFAVGEEVLLRGKSPEPRRHFSARVRGDESNTNMRREGTKAT